MEEENLVSRNNGKGPPPQRSGLRAFPSVHKEPQKISAKNLFKRLLESFYPKDLKILLLIKLDTKHKRQNTKQRPRSLQAEQGMTPIAKIEIAIPITI